MAVVIPIAVLPKAIEHRHTVHRYTKSCLRYLFLLESALIFQPFCTTEEIQM